MVWLILMVIVSVCYFILGFPLLIGSVYYENGEKYILFPRLHKLGKFFTFCGISLLPFILLEVILIVK